MIRLCHKALFLPPRLFHCRAYYWLANTTYTLKQRTLLATASPMAWELKLPHTRFLLLCFSFFLLVPLNMSPHTPTNTFIYAFFFSKQSLIHILISRKLRPIKARKKLKGPAKNLNGSGGSTIIAKGIKPSVRGLKCPCTSWIQKSKNETGHKCQNTSQTQSAMRSEIQTQIDYKVWDTT